MRSNTEQWNKLYSVNSTYKELDLIYMWVKQGVIDKQTFIDMIEFVFPDGISY